MLSRWTARQPPRCVAKCPVYNFHQEFRYICRCRHTAIAAQLAAQSEPQLSDTVTSVRQRQVELEKDLQAAKQGAEAQAAAHACAVAEHEAMLRDQTEQQAAQSKAGMASLAEQVVFKCFNTRRSYVCCVLRAIVLTIQRACLQVKQLQEERDKLAVAAAASDERRAQIELLEKCLQQERSASAAAAADADRNLDAAKAVVHAARATVAAKERKASNLEALVEGAGSPLLPLSTHVLQHSCMRALHTHVHDTAANPDAAQSFTRRWRRTHGCGATSVSASRRRRPAPWPSA